MQLGRRVIATDDNSATARGGQIRDDRVAPLRERCVRRLVIEQRRSEGVKLRGPKREAVIGEDAGRTRRRFHTVEPRRRRLGAPRGEVARVTHAAGQRGEEVGVQGDDDVAIREVVTGLQRVAERESGTGVYIVARERLIGVPGRRGIALQERLAQPLRGRRCAWLGEYAHAAAVARGAQARREFVAERRPARRVFRDAADCACAARSTARKCLPERTRPSRRDSPDATGCLRP